MKSAKSLGQNILAKKLKKSTEIQRTNSQNFNYLLEFTTPRTQQQNVMNIKFDHNNSFKKNPLQTSYYGSTKQSTDFKQVSNINHSKQKVTKELIEKLLKDDNQTPQSAYKSNKISLNAAAAQNLQKSKKQNLSKKQFYDSKSPSNLKIAKRRTSKQQQPIIKQNMTKSTQSSSKNNQKFSITLANNNNNNIQKHKQQTSFNSIQFQELFTKNQITGIKTIVQNELKQFLTLQKIKSLDQSQKNQTLDDRSQQFYNNLMKQMQVFEKNDLNKQIHQNSLFSPYFLNQIQSQKSAKTSAKVQGTNFRAKLKNLINYGKKKQNFYSPKLYQSQCPMQQQMRKIIERMKNVFSSFEKEKINHLKEKKQMQSMQVRQTPRNIQESPDKK